MNRTLADPLKTRIDDWWRRTYPYLAADLGFDPHEDEAAAHRLASLLEENENTVLAPHRIPFPERVVVAGAADRLQTDLEAHPVTDDEALIVADGALPTALAHHKPDLIVSDLDGDPEQVARLNQQGVLVAVHAHGDNIPRLETWIPHLKGPLLATRQTPGKEPALVICPGGFADGDRAVLLAARLGAKEIRLVGFDLHGEPGRISPTQVEQKRRKMRWSARILDEARELGVPITSTW
jgi:2-amino-4-hydroxy-6-hydroxymethyldihydropteridine diphosphokinase